MPVHLIIFDFVHVTLRLSVSHDLILEFLDHTHLCTTVDITPLDE